MQINLVSVSKNGQLKNKCTSVVLRVEKTAIPHPRVEIRGFSRISAHSAGWRNCGLFRGQDPPIPQAWYRRPKLHMRMLTHAVCAYFPKILLGKHLPAPLKSFTCLFAPLCCAYVLAQFETDVICAGSRVFPWISAEIRILRTRKLSNGFAAE